MMNENANWQRTYAVQSRMEDKDGYEEPSKEFPYGRMQGPDGKMHQIVGRDVKVRDGIYPGTSEREVIWVNEGLPGNKEKPWEGNLNRAFNNLVDIVHARMKKGGEQEAKANLLRDVLELTRKWLPSDNIPGQMSADDRVAQFVADSGAKKDGWMSLEQFMGNVGVCRHQALLAAYLLERAQEEGIVSSQSKISVDRNSIPGLGAHAWVRYLNRGGQEYIIDPRQNFIGTVEQAEQMAKDQKAVWSYRRPNPNRVEQPEYQPKKAMAIRVEPEPKPKSPAVPKFIEDMKRRVKQLILVYRAQQQPLELIEAVKMVVKQIPKLDIKVIEFMEDDMNVRLSHAASRDGQANLLTNYLLKHLKNEESGSASHPQTLAG